MKNLKTIAIAIFVAVSTIATAQSKKVDATKSSIHWVGKKVTGQHEGTIKLKASSVGLKGAVITLIVK
jgi:hypothetical protein